MNQCIIPAAAMAPISIKLQLGALSLLSVLDVQLHLALGSCWLALIHRKHLPVVKAPNPHNVKAILALAPTAVAVLMYMMMGEAVKAHAQLKRLSFCRLQSRLSSE